MSAFKPWTMKPGYAYEIEGPAAWFGAPDDAFDTVMYTPTGAETEVGTRFIDGARCVVFTCPDGKYRAQTVVVCEAPAPNQEEAPCPPPAP